MSVATRRPALGAAVSVILGVTAGTVLETSGWIHALVASVVLVLLALLRGRPHVGLLLLSLFLLGGWRAASGIDRAELDRTRLVETLGGTSAERHVAGRVTVAPQVAASGERSFRLRGKVEGDTETRAFRVRVRASGSAAANRRTDRLRRGDRVRSWGRIHVGESPLSEPHLAVKSAWLVEPLASSPGPLAAVDGMRVEARARLDHLMRADSSERALAGAMLLGDRRRIDAALVDLLRRSGLAHLVAISGLHVGLLVGMLAGLLGRLRGVGHDLRLIGGLTVITWLAATVSEQASVLRATLGTTVWLAGRRWGWQGDPLNTLALIAAGLLVYEPAAVTSPGFQLTFVATAALVGNVSSVSSADSSRLLAPLRISAVAYAATSPLVAWHFGRLAPIGIAANLVALPLAATLLGSGYLALVCAPVPVVATSLAWLATTAARGILSVAEWSASWTGLGWIVTPPRPGSIVVHYGLLLVVLFAPSRRLAAIGRASLGALVLSTVSLHVGTSPADGPGPDDRATVLDVGQGLAVAVRAAGGGTALVDAGGSYRSEWDPGRRIVVPWLLENWGRRVDVVIVSHDDLDHAGGLFAVLRELEVGQLWIGPDAHRTPRSRELMDLAHRRGVAVVLAERGSRGQARELFWRILSPSRRSSLRAGNERSLVTIFGRSPHRLLVTGDIGSRAEAELVDAGLDLGAEALVLSHHGSRDGSSERFLERVGCRLAIASAGTDNRFGHPHPETVERVRAAGARVLGTDRCGDIELVGELARAWSVSRHLFPCESERR